MLTRLSDTRSAKERAGEPPTRPGTRRQRAYRQRARSGKIILRIEVDHGRLIEAIVRHGALTETETLCRARVEQVAAQMIDEVIALYVDKR